MNIEELREAMNYLRPQIEAGIEQEDYFHLLLCIIGFSMVIVVFLSEINTNAIHPAILAPCIIVLIIGSVKWIALAGICALPMLKLLKKIVLPS